MASIAVTGVDMSHRNLMSKLAANQKCCQKCAFRAGSPERKDPFGWMNLVDAWTASGSFICHESIPGHPGYVVDDKPNYRICAGRIAAEGMTSRQLLKLGSGWIHPQRHYRVMLKLSWQKMQLLRRPVFHVPIGAHHWVTFESIQQAIASGKRDDPSIPWTERTHRAARIGTMAEMMRSGTTFPPLALRVNHRGIEIEDGMHRLRAQEYRGDDTLTFMATGTISLLREALL